ncbi:MAG: hypothetical protein C4K49_06815 [Candidatus Thorarchaeota archaeon]|nr:MAG: hypothetical protein C4K49_06815 [Candidatus Thorarchaeota archaeon]
MRTKRVAILLFLMMSLTFGGMFATPALPAEQQTQSDTQVVDLGDGTTVEVAPDEMLYEYVISAAPSEKSGTGTALTVSEYGIRTDTFSDRTMTYASATQTTTTANLSVPLGDQWQGYKVFGNVTDITENRTWVLNSGFGTAANWTYRTSQVEGSFSGNDRVQVFSSAGSYQRKWGSRGTGNGLLIDPWGIAINSTGYVYIADTYNNRIQIFTRTGSYVAQWGSYGTGPGQFDRPMGIAINTTGYVYVADFGNDRVQVFNSRGFYQRSWGSTGDTPTNGVFHGPVGVAILDSNGRVYVVDSGNSRVQYFGSTGTYVGQWAVSGLPRGISIYQASSWVYVSETSNNRVRRFDANGLNPLTFPTILSPDGIAVSSTGYVYVNNAGSSPGTHRVTRYNTGGGAAFNWGSDGTADGQFRINTGIAVNATGYVYTTESGGEGRLASKWLSTGHGTGNGAPSFLIDGYWHDAGSGLYGYWYNPGDKAFIRQDLAIPRGQVTWLGISLDYYADCRGWANYMTGFFELFVSAGDPDSGGRFLWNRQFDKIADDNIWYSTGIIPISPSLLTLPNVALMAGLRVTQSEWYRTNDIMPEGRLDNIILYVKAKATPTNINLRMDGVVVSNLMNGSNPFFGLGVATYSPSVPWTSGFAYGNFSWTPTPNPPDPDLNILVEIDVRVTVWARRYNVLTINDTERFTTGDNYAVQNATTVRWTTNHYVAVPGGYSTYYFYNLSTPINRDIDFVAEPYHRDVNLTYGWSYGRPGDGRVNVSVYSVTTVNQNGFWLLKGSSPNTIRNLEVWNAGASAWTSTKTFRANENTRFRANLSDTYAGDTVYFTVYDPAGNAWRSLQAIVDGSGMAVTGYVSFGAANSSVGAWEVQAFSVDSTSSGGSVRNVGYYRRAFAINHSTSALVKYPEGSEITWTYNATFGELVFLQLRVNDTDNGDLLPGGSMTYLWAAGTGQVNDMGTGEYSVSLDTGALSSNGQFSVNIQWSKQYYDSIARTFSINVIYTTELLSADAPGVDVPRGYDAQLHLNYRNEVGGGIQSAVIICNWTMDSYSVTPEVGSPGNYILSLQTDAVSLASYRVMITAKKDFFETRSIILSVQVRELHTSAIPSASLLSLPVGYTTSLTITYTDTDHGTPITGAAGAIRCNWSEKHTTGDQNYTVTETATPGVYQVTLISKDLDVLRTYSVVFNVQAYGSQNHTFTVTVVLRTHLTSFYFVNPISPTPYTGHIQIYVSYFDFDTGTGIENGSYVGYNVRMRATTAGLPGLMFTVTNGTVPGEYIISISADQWGSVGTKYLTFYANWTGPTVKYFNRTLYTDTGVIITASPTDIFIGQSPVITPYGENISFSVVYYDTAEPIGIVNGTGPFAGNVRIFVAVVTSGQTLNQNLMEISEIDFLTRPGEYRIEFSSQYLTGIIGCELRIWLNWTAGELPYYGNQSLFVTVYTTYRLTTVDWTPLPITAFDELVDLTFVYRDVITGDPILNSSKLTVSVQESISYDVFYDGDLTGMFRVRVNTASWTPGSRTFHLNVVWSGSPFYQNRTLISIPVTVRYRYTDLTHGAYAPVQYGNNLTIVFSYRDLDDIVTTGIDGATLRLDSWLAGYYNVFDNHDGTYTLVLITSSFPSPGLFVVNASITYNGLRYCDNASDFFYLTLTQRNTQLTSELPELAPYLTQANITVRYIDDSTGVGIVSADVFAGCSTSSEQLQKGVNYWVDDLTNGYYRVRVSTIALGGFGLYSVAVTANWTGAPFYFERVRSVNIEVSRRPAGLTVSRSPLNTPFLENIVFEVSVTDTLDGSPIVLTKAVLILTHGSGTLISPSEYVLSGSAGLYTISFNSTLITSVLVNEHPISIKLFWGDTTPYYSNATAVTEASVTARSTQASVISTPPAYYYFNISAIVKYSDYLTSAPISGATLTFRCLNASVQHSWWFDRGDGTYQILVNSTDLPSLGKYFFTANFTWTGQPFFNNISGIVFSVVVNPVSTVLTFEMPIGVTHYMGETIVANVTFRDIATGSGVSGANVQTNWKTLFGTDYTLVEIGKGLWNLTIQTSGLNAGIYSFSINASKYLHQNRTVTADLVLASMPVDIALIATPTSPSWGDTVQIRVNVTASRTGDPITGASVNLTISPDLYLMTDLGNGTYRCTVPTVLYSAGEYTMSVTFALVNYETREQGFQIRVSKVPATLAGVIDLITPVNGQLVTVEAQYRIESNSTSITTGHVTYSWTGGSGLLVWQPAQSRYVTQFIVTDVLVGSYQLLVLASSDNYRTVSVQLTLTVLEVRTELLAYEGQTVLSAISGNSFNITVYLNNTDLSLPVSGALLTYGFGEGIGNLTDNGGGYYTALVSTGTLEIRDWVLTVSSSKAGFSPSSVQFRIAILKIPTRVIVGTSAAQEGFYGRNVTYLFTFWDSHNNVSIPNATATFALESVGGQLVDLRNGSYSLEIDTTWVSAGAASRDISVFFSRSRYDYAYAAVKLVVRPIPTEVLGFAEVSVPVGDDYSHLFIFNDTLNNALIAGATASAVSPDFGLKTMTDLGNGSYRLGPAETGISRLEVRTEPYTIRIQLSKGNFSLGEIVFHLTIRRIATEIRAVAPPNTVYTRQVFTVLFTFWDTDHNVLIPGALNTTPGSTVVVVSSENINFGDGRYQLGFMAPQVGVFYLIIHLDKTDYETGVYSAVVYALMSEEQQALVNAFTYGALALILAAVFGAFYVRVLSVPKMLRWIRSMISKLSKGRIPKPAPVKNRRQMLLDLVNTELAPVHIIKTVDDISISTVDVAALDVEKLLTELATVVGLTEKDIDTLRQDLEKMRPSERAGFIGEVLKQERARRARELVEAEKAAEPGKAVERLARKLTEEELTDLRERLIKMGIQESEADLMVEQARSLTKAEVDALLDQIGGDKP